MSRDPRPAEASHVADLAAEGRPTDREARFWAHALDVLESAAAKTDVRVLDDCAEAR